MGQLVGGGVRKRPTHLVVFTTAVVPAVPLPLPI